MSDFTVLEGLECSDIQMTLLELGTNTQLLGRDCRNNRLRYLDLNDIKQLKYCCISGNSQKGEYTVVLTNSKLRENIPDDAFQWASSVSLISVFLDVRVGMGNESLEPDDPSDSDDPTKPGDTTANEVLGVLASAALQGYPNPATDVLHVALRASGDGVSATGSATGSVTGSAVGSAAASHTAAPAATESLRTVRILSVGGHLYRNFASGFDHLNVGDLPAGIYLLEAETTAGTVLRHKFVKR